MTLTKETKRARSLAMRRNTRCKAQFTSPNKADAVFGVMAAKDFAALRRLSSGRVEGWMEGRQRS
jgi:hypothetical protein